jgi:hypothetical protein
MVAALLATLNRALVAEWSQTIQCATRKNFQEKSLLSRATGVVCRKLHDYGD